MRESHGTRRIALRAVVALTVGLAFAGMARADIIATHIADAQQSILNRTIMVDIDPGRTRWVAWHDRTMPTDVGGQPYVGSYSWIAVDDFFDLTVTNPSGASQTVRMDYNDALALSSGPQAVIFGSTADAPNVARWGATWSPASAGRAGSPKIFDEGGAFNGLFTSAGTYTFKFLSGNTGSTVVGYPNMYLLVEEVPEPGAVLLLTLGAVPLLGRRRGVGRQSSNSVWRARAWRSSAIRG